LKLKKLKFELENYLTTSFPHLTPSVISTILQLIVNRSGKEALQFPRLTDQMDYILRVEQVMFIGLKLGELENIINCPPPLQVSCDREEMKLVMDNFIAYILPAHKNKPTNWVLFHRDILNILKSENANDHNLIHALEVIEEIPLLQKQAIEDIQETFDMDPAAKSVEEVILCYPGIMAITVHRLAHLFYVKGYPIIARMLSEISHQNTGIDIHPGAQIGSHFFIDHGTGIVIGETAVIGDHVKMFQGVTLGTKKFSFDETGKVVRGEKRHPTIGNHVALYANATVLGGETSIADHVVIGSNAFVNKSVTIPGSVVLPRAR
jgi:serine O-acetyltransferase